MKENSKILKLRLESQKFSISNATIINFVIVLQATFVESVKTTNLNNEIQILIL